MDVLERMIYHRYLGISSKIEHFYDNNTNYNTN